MNTRACVYTALLGDYEKLNEQPVAAQSKVDFICFTDDRSLASKTWKIVAIDPTFKRDPVRSQRVIKLSPHEYCSDYDVSLYIDNSIILTVPPEEIFDRYSEHLDFLIPTHSFRDCVLDEFREVNNLALSDPRRIREQLRHYLDTNPDCLREKPYWSGVQIRRHSHTGVRQALRIWLAHVLRYSRRDQLSANVAFQEAGVSPYRLDIDNRASWFHTWPAIYDRNESVRTYKPNSWLQRRRPRLGLFEANLFVSNVSSRTKQIVQSLF
jgi:hypothetical protein